LIGLRDHEGIYIGNDNWATLLIQAHHKEEYARLQMAFLKMPVTAPARNMRSIGAYEELNRISSILGIVE